MLRRSHFILISPQGYHSRRLTALLYANILQECLTCERATKPCAPWCLSDETLIEVDHWLHFYATSPSSLPCSSLMLASSLTFNFWALESTSSSSPEASLNFLFLLLLGVFAVFLRPPFVTAVLPSGVSGAASSLLAFVTAPFSAILPPLYS